MARSGLIERVADKAAIRRWRQLGGKIDQIALSDLKDIRTRAKTMQSEVYKVLASTEERLTAPLSRTDTIKDSLNADWAWRPTAWKTTIAPHGMAEVTSGASFGDGLKVFHDCPHCENALRQRRNTRSIDLASYGLSLEFFGFGGSFFSLVVDLPEDGITDLNHQNLIRMETDVTSERPIKAFARLNLKNGPNTAQMVAEVDFSKGGNVEFDLGYADFNEARIEAAWVEMIFENPSNNQITIHDLTLLRRTRAEL